MNKAYKFRIYPNKQQEELIQKTFECVRHVFNHFLDRRIKQYELNKSTLSLKDCSAELTQYKQEFEWLKEPDKWALQNSLKDLERAYQNFFRRVKKGDKKVGFPKWKTRKNVRKSYRTTQTNRSIEILSNQIKLPKLGKVKCKISTQPKGRVLNATISQAPSGKYFVSVCCTDVEIPQYEPTGAVVGIDLGIKSIAVTSDNVEHPNNKYTNKSAKKLAKEQRKLSRKTIGSSNWEKQRVKVARVYEKIANQRSDGIHKMTTELVKSYDVICIEDLSIADMIKDRKLAKAISDCAWGEIVRQLGYKCDWQRKLLQKVDRYFPSSQLCECGYKNSKVKDLGIRAWICPRCKKLNDRDKNAAENILREGLRLIAAQ